MEPTLIGAITGLATAIAGLSGGSWLRDRHARQNGGGTNAQLLAALKDISTSFSVAAANRQQQTQILMDRVASMEARFIDQNTRMVSTLAEIAGTLQALSKR